MRISKIEAQQKDPHRFNLYIDDQFWMGVSEDTLIKFMLTKDKTIDQKTKEEIAAYEHVNKIYNKSLHYLSFGLRTKQEMQEYIRKHIESDQENIEDYEYQIINKLESLGYLNDLEYAKAYVRTQARINKKGPTTIVKELQLKHIEKDHIEKAILEYTYDQQLENLADLARKYTLKTRKLSEKKLTNKLWTYLYHKGYKKEMINNLQLSDFINIDPDIERNNLENEAQKFMQKKRTKFVGYMLKQKFIEYMLRKGYSYEDISNWIEEHGLMFEKGEA